MSLTRTFGFAVDSLAQLMAGMKHLVLREFESDSESDSESDFESDSEPDSESDSDPGELDDGLLLLSVKEIDFTQSSIKKEFKRSRHGNDDSEEEPEARPYDDIVQMAHAIKTGKLAASSVDRIRVVLKDGVYRSLDNRRLWALRHGLAGRREHAQRIVVKVVDLADPRIAREFVHKSEQRDARVAIGDIHIRDGLERAHPRVKERGGVFVRDGGYVLHYWNSLSAKARARYRANNPRLADEYDKADAAVARRKMEREQREKEREQEREKWQREWQKERERERERAAAVAESIKQAESAAKAAKAAEAEQQRLTKAAADAAGKERLIALVRASAVDPPSMLSRQQQLLQPRQQDQQAAEESQLQARRGTGTAREFEFEPTYAPYGSYAPAAYGYGYGVQVDFGVHSYASDFANFFPAAAAAARRTRMHILPDGHTRTRATRGMTFSTRMPDRDTPRRISVRCGGNGEKLKHTSWEQP